MSETTSIRIKCTCGKQLKAKPSLAGKRVKCPACGVTVQIPKRGKAGTKVNEQPVTQVHAADNPTTKSASQSRPRATNLPPKPSPSQASRTLQQTPRKKGKLSAPLIAAIAGIGGLVILVLVLIGVVALSFFGPGENTSLSVADATADVRRPSQDQVSASDAQTTGEDTSATAPRDWSLTEEEKSALVRHDIGLGLTMLGPSNAEINRRPAFDSAVIADFSENFCVNVSKRPNERVLWENEYKQLKQQPPQLSDIVLDEGDLVIRNLGETCVFFALVSVNGEEIRCTTCGGTTIDFSRADCEKMIKCVMSMQHTSTRPGSVESEPDPVTVVNADANREEAIAAIEELGGSVTSSDEGTKLELSGDISDAHMVYLKHFPETTSLTITSEAVTDAGLKHLKHLNKIKHLRISAGLTVSSVSDSGLVHMKPLTELESLYLGGCIITDEGLTEVAGLTNLRSLDLFSCRRITDDGFAELATLAYLEDLSVQSTGISGEGLQHLTACENLTTLDVGYNPITSSGMIQIGQLTQLKKLTLTHAWLPRRTDAFADSDLQSLAGLTNLETLNLRLNNITDAGLTHLHGLKNLRSLSIPRNKEVTSAGIEELERALPECSIK